MQVDEPQVQSGATQADPRAAARYQ